MGIWSCQPALHPELIRHCEGHLARQFSMSTRYVAACKTGAPRSSEIREVLLPWNRARATGVGEWAIIKEKQQCEKLHFWLRCYAELSSAAQLKPTHIVGARSTVVVEAVGRTAIS